MKRSKPLTTSLGDLEEVAAAGTGYLHQHNVHVKAAQAFPCGLMKYHNRVSSISCMHCITFTTPRTLVCKHG